MPQVSETPLPGLGQRVEFISDEGNRIGVIHHRTGRRELFVCRASDPDAVALTITLSDDESHALADALGGSSIIEGLSRDIEGLAIDWVKVGQTSPIAGRTVADARVRTETGVSVVAVIRDGAANPAPGPEFQLQPGDTAVVVGTPEGIAAVRRIFDAD